MLKAEGYSVINAPGSRPLEHDTITCAHCGFITFTKGGLGTPLTVAVVHLDQSVTMREVKRCHSCWGYICPKCEAIGECNPRMKRIEEEEKQALRLILP